MTGYISESERGLLFRAGVRDALMEKTAKVDLKSFSEFLKVLKNAGGVLVSPVPAAWGLTKETVNLLKALSVYGAGAGTVGSVAWNLIKDRMQRESPETEFNRKVEAMYAGRARELEDAKWMDRVRGMRDDLARNYKKMPSDEYEKRYGELMDALDERLA